MRIGIARSLTDSMSGGVFQYEIVFLKALSEIATRFPEEFLYICYNAADLFTLGNAGGLTYRGLRVAPLSKPAPQLQPPEAFTRQRPPTPMPFDPHAVKFDYATGEMLQKHAVDLLLLLSPNVQAFSFRLPFVVPIFDLNHRLQPEFPEVSAFGETNNREYFYINTCKFATLVLVDSEWGKADVLQFYGTFIDEDRIRILPMYPPIADKPLPDAQELARVRAKYSLPDRYFFYPAQFWPHKNHKLILQALKLIADESGEKIPVVFCGAYWTYTMATNFRELVGLATSFGLSDCVRYLGSVPDEDMGPLYTLCTGLVMPTFFGPSNIPPLEAWHFGRPVVTSDIRGLREQSGDAALLVDPRSPPAMAEALKRLWHDEAFCLELAERGRKRLSSYKWDTFVENVTAILIDACDRVRTGRTPRYP
jgi:glycosyltransferase involved in cell wall biosynthesis